MSLKDKLKALTDEAKGMRDTTKEIKSNHAEMMDNLNKIEDFVGNNKTAIEGEMADNAEIAEAYKDLEKVLIELKENITELKTQNVELKDKVAGVAAGCVFGGTALGLAAATLLSKLKGVVGKYKTVSTT